MDCDLGKTPTFGNPPVVETVLGIQFKPLPRFGVTHMGRFQQEIEQRGFIHAQEQPRLEHQIEQKESNVHQLFFAPWATLPRIWYLTEADEDGEQLIQIQNDRLVQNWRRRSLKDSTYPSYSKNRANFLETWKTFLDFAEKQQIGPVQPDQCELIYVNQIPLSDFENAQIAFADCFGIRLQTPTLEKCGSEMEKMSFQCSYWSDMLNGRIHIGADSSSPIGTAGNIIQLTLTARGMSASQEIDHLMNWMDQAHYLVVNSFADVTTGKMHSKWERKS